MASTVTQIEFYTWEDVSKFTGYKKTKACEIINGLQDELEKMGYLRPKRGTIPKKFFHEKFYA